eukprot:COSAG01_NODE_14738_length_1416_cov_3.087320_1_plen_185_part_10
MAAAAAAAAAPECSPDAAAVAAREEEARSVRESARKTPAEELGSSSFTGVGGPLFSRVPPPASQPASQPLSFRTWRRGVTAQSSAWIGASQPRQRPGKQTHGSARKRPPTSAAAAAAAAVVVDAGLPERQLQLEVARRRGESGHHTTTGAAAGPLAPHAVVAPRKLPPLHRRRPAAADADARLLP